MPYFALYWINNGQTHIQLSRIECISSNFLGNLSPRKFDIKMIFYCAIHISWPQPSVHGLLHPSCTFCYVSGRIQRMTETKALNRSGRFSVNVNQQPQLLISAFLHFLMQSIYYLLPLIELFPVINKKSCSFISSCSFTRQ